jgi:hypothetical protein
VGHSRESLGRLGKAFKALPRNAFIKTQQSNRDAIWRVYGESKYLSDLMTVFIILRKKSSEGKIKREQTV